MDEEMKTYHNITPDPLKRGQYCGSGGGNIWEIFKSSRCDGNYAAYPRLGTIQERNTALMAWSLSDMSAKLAALPCE